MTIPKILIAEDHTLFRHAIKNLIQCFDMEVDVAEHGAAGLLKLSKQNYDLVITDLQMPVMDGAEFTEKMKKTYPEIKIIVLTMHDSIKYVRHMIELGVQSFLPKSIEPDELEIAIKEVLKGKTYFPQGITAMLVQDLLIKPKQMVDDFALTEREVSILRLIGGEKTVAEISEELGISPRTVEAHKLKMIEKLKVKSTIGLVKIAVQKGLVE